MRRPDDSGRFTAADALLILRAAVGASPCDGEVCDVDNTTGTASAVDSLRILKIAIGIGLELDCFMGAP